MPDTILAEATDIERALERRVRLIAGLRDLAAFLEQHPTVEAPRYNILNVFVNSRDELATAARGASWEKVYNENWFSLRKTFCEDLALEINAGRETVCRKVVKGTRTIPAQPEREVEDVEWICEDASLLNGEAVPA